MKIILPILILMLSACASTNKGAKTALSSHDLRDNTLADVVANYPKDTVVLNQLAIKRLQQYETNKNLYTLNQAIATYHELFKRQPYNHDVLLNFYRLNLIKSFATNSYDVEHWQAFYQQQPFLKTVDIAPPVYMQLPLAAKGSLSLEERKSILQKTVMDNPNFVNGYMALAALYAEQNDIQLSVFLLETAAKNSPNNSDILGILNDYRVDKIFDQLCKSDTTERLNQTFEDYKFLVNKFPEDAYYHMQLSTVLRLMGRIRMSNFSAKKAASLNADFKTGLVESEFWLGNNKVVTEYFSDKEALSLNTDDLYLAILFNVVNFNWQPAADLMQEYVTRSDRSFYGVLYGAHAFKMLNKIDIAQQITQTGLASLNIKPWQQQMLNFANEEITSDELISASENSCNLSEAYFIQGLSDVKAEKMTDFQQKMEAVVSLNIYPFYEYAGAKQIVKRLKRDTAKN
jgi:hypothetical protein